MPKAQTLKKEVKNRLEKEIQFEFYAPLALEVGLGGTFNSWEASKHKLRKDQEGRWRLAIKLKPGRYEYRYLVDGNWQNDQRSNVACVPNSFGTWNCVVEVA